MPVDRLGIFAQAKGDSTMNMIDVLIVLALLATVGTLIMGVGSMVRGGKYDQQHAGQLMSARVGLQAATFILLLLALLLG
jgi:hypothetical protein